MESTETMHALMLAVAQDAIAVRAARDGYGPNEYDAAEDPDGFIVSLVNGLHQWCAVNRIDWEAELLHAQELFRKDLEEAGLEPPAYEQPEAKELSCPSCGHKESFVVELAQHALLFSDGTILDGDESWDDGSACWCHACRFAGTVRQFRTSNPHKRR